MERYYGEGLPRGLRIAVLSNDALGNFVVVTPLLQLLRTELEPARIDYFGGKRVQELADASDLIDSTFPLHGEGPHGLARFIGRVGLPDYHLVVNVENSPWAKTATAMLAGAKTLVIGPSLDEEGRKDLPFQEDDRGHLWSDPDWTAEDLPIRYPFLSTPFIGEIFCRLAYLEGRNPGYRLPSEAPETTCDVIISTTATLAGKLWPLECWEAAVRSLRGRGMTVGLVGAKPVQSGRFWQGTSLEEALVRDGDVVDLRGTLTLPQVVGTLAAAKLVLTLDNGILHLAAAAGVPTLGLFRHGIHRLWAPPFPNVHVAEPGPGRTVSDLGVPQVLDRMERVLGTKN